MSSATVNDRLPRPLRLIDDEDVVCPAGCPARAGTGVMCRIEGAVVDGRRNPATITLYCTGDNRNCPTWQADKEAVWAGQRGALDAGA